MSLSVSHTPRVTVDASRVEKNTVSPATPHTPSQHHAESAFFNNEVMNPAAALTKLFDMLDMVFRAMREMMSLKRPAFEVRAEPGKQPAAPAAAVVPTQTPSQPANVVPQEAAKPSKRDVPATQTHPHSVKPDDGRSAVVRYPYEIPPFSPHPEVEPFDVQQPERAVINDAKANVHLNVNVGRCPCPDTSAPPIEHMTNRMEPQPGRHFSPAQRHYVPIDNTTPERAAVTEPKLEVNRHVQSVTTSHAVPDTAPTALRHSPTSEITSPGHAGSRPKKTTARAM
ncbi:hypothetical protein [Pseudomonas sp. FP2309]|uniref:hypothetical protein n=1 Tax=Pseudomonas sp. FP2309 TaxID=2954091 RepID=UPI0027360557|nr:hypothetical protein [Pseudomonas sp. FP2309]WLH66801.1 hypothetical protein PSH59_16890 [Pseudomonas sp. FP2309]